MITQISIIQLQTHLVFHYQIAQQQYMPLHFKNILTKILRQWPITYRRSQTHFTSHNAYHICVCHYKKHIIQWQKHPLYHVKTVITCQKTYSEYHYKKTYHEITTKHIILTYNTMANPTKIRWQKHVLYHYKKPTITQKHMLHHYKTYDNTETHVTSLQLIYYTITIS